MAPLNLGVGFLAGLLIRLSLAFSPARGPQHASFQRLQLPRSHGAAQLTQEQQKEPQQVNTVRVLCHPDSMEVIIQADMFAVGAAVDGRMLRLGVESDGGGSCRAQRTSADEYRIIAGLGECGTRHLVTQDLLVYTNLLIYSAEASPNGVMWMDEALVPIECHYDRKYSMSSSSLRPTWIPFISSQSAVETLEFDLKLMTDDWTAEKNSQVFYIGEPLYIESSVRVGHHVGLRVFMSSCVATLHPDMYSEPRYVFVENGCLVDSQIPGSGSHFLPRTQKDKLQLIINAFKFHNEDQGELYITCHLNAVPINDSESPNKACTFVDGRWLSADQNDYLCGDCQGQKEVGQSLGKPWNSDVFRPRGFRPSMPESSRKNTLKAPQVWEQETRLGPVMVLPSQKSEPLPANELPSVLRKMIIPALYGSAWRSGINKSDVGKELLSSSPDLHKNNDRSGLEEKRSPGKNDTAFDLKVESMTTTAAPTDPTPLHSAEMDPTPLHSAETTQSYVTDMEYDSE
ncbi:zona pellucida sperm-binding protein 3-like [Pholidichthys leucotaenia]